MSNNEMRAANTRVKQHGELEHVEPETLADYIDFVTGMEQNAAIEAHLRTCARCRIAVQMGRHEAGTALFFEGLTGKHPGSRSSEALWPDLVESFAPGHQWLSPIAWDAPTWGPEITKEQRKTTVGSFTCTLQHGELGTAAHLTVESRDASTWNQSMTVLLLERTGSEVLPIFGDEQRVEVLDLAGGESAGNEHGEAVVYGFAVKITPNNEPAGERIIALSMPLPIEILPFPPFKDAGVETLPREEELAIAGGRNATRDTSQREGLVLSDDWNGVRCELFAGYPKKSQAADDQSAGSPLVLTIKASLSKPDLIGRTVVFHLALTPNRALKTMPTEGMREFAHVFTQAGETFEKQMPLPESLQGFRDVALSVTVRDRGDE